MSGPPDTARGYDAREVVSALQKAIRRSDPDAALYWGVELARSGYGNWLWARLRTICAEDVSPEATGVVADLHALNTMWASDQKRNRGEGLLFVTRALIALATAKKNRVATWGLLHHISDYTERREIPDHALDKHTARGRQTGRSDAHFVEEAAVLEPWTGSLEELEAEYREHRRARVNEESVRTDPPGHPGSDPPPNPWPEPRDVPGPSGKPAQKDHPTLFGQVRLRGDTQEER